MSGVETVGVRQRVRGGDARVDDEPSTTPKKQVVGNNKKNSKKAQKGTRSCRTGDGRGAREFLGYIGELFTAIVAQLAVSFGIKSSGVKFELNDFQREKLDALRKRAEEPYDSSKTEHVDALKRLWESAFGKREKPPSDMKSERWKEMGWQGTSPETDFRAGGYLSLQNLLWLAQNDKKLFDELRTKSRGTRSDFEYPFAVAGVNLTFNLVELLEVKEKSPSTPSGIAFARLIELDDCAFEKIYVLAFDVLEAEWLNYPNANYMDFPHVMKSMKEVLRSLLKDVNSFEEVEKRRKANAL